MIYILNKRSVSLFLGIILVVGVFMPLIGTSQDSKEFDNVKISVDIENEIIYVSYELESFEFEEVVINGEHYKKILIDKESNLKVKGSPDIPQICRSILIPDDKKMQAEILNYEYEEISNVLVSPSKGALLRSISPKNVDYEFGEEYQKDKYYPGKIVDLGNPYLLRDFRGQVLNFYPIQYNPVTKNLRFIKQINLKIQSVGNGEINCIQREKFPAIVSSDFSNIYQKHFINYPPEFTYNPVEEQGNMLVITYDDFYDQMIDFVNWKNMKGIPTEMIRVSEIGNANAIKSYISDYYNDNGLTFVLLVGDAQQVPTLYSGGASDPSYSYILGSDHYPDIFVGRFSAQNAGQLETQIERSVEYEKYPQVGEQWYKKGVGIASDEGPGEDGEYDWQHIRNIRTDLVSYLYTEVNEFYDGSQGGEDASGNPSPSMIASALNQGRSIINYCGHGSPWSWGSSGFDNDDVSALQNDNKLPFIWSVACNNGEFDSYSSCFAEAWLRATHNNEPTGAIAMFASSVGQYWDPPMAAQDEFVDLLVDENKLTFGGISFNGCMLMNDQFGMYGEDMTDTWHVFGDPSLQIRTRNPTDITVNHISSIPIGASSIEIEVEGVEGALCAVSRNYNLLGFAYTDISGNALIEFDEPMTYGDDLDVVVTHYNKLPYFGTVSVVGEDDPPEKPDEPNGPRSGGVGLKFTYTAVTTDPDGDEISYKFDWGDGTESDWTDFVASGEEGSASKTWTEEGEYEVKVKARDDIGAVSDWSDSLTVTIDKAEIGITRIRGGIGRLSIFIENIGEITAHSIDWNVSIKGGILDKIDIESGCDTCTDPLETGDHFIERTDKFIFGFGSIEIEATAKAEDSDKVKVEATGYVLGPFILGVNIIE